MRAAGSLSASSRIHNKQFPSQNPTASVETDERARKNMSDASLLASNSAVPRHCLDSHSVFSFHSSQSESKVHFTLAQGSCSCKNGTDYTSLRSYQSGLFAFCFRHCQSFHLSAHLSAPQRIRQGQKREYVAAFMGTSST